jgi:hypothetical protein
MDDAVNVFVLSWHELIVAFVAFAARWKFYQLRLLRRMWVMAVGAVAQLESSVRNRRGFHDPVNLVVALEAERGSAVFIELVEAAFMAGPTILEDGRVGRLGEKHRVAGSMGAMAGRAVESSRFGAQVFRGELGVVGVVAKQTQAGTRFGQKAWLSRAMRHVACRTVIGRGRVAGLGARSRDDINVAAGA